MSHTHTRTAKNYGNFPGIFPIRQMFLYLESQLHTHTHTDRIFNVYIYQKIKIIRQIDDGKILLKHSYNIDIMVVPTKKSISFLENQKMFPEKCFRKIFSNYSFHFRMNDFNNSLSLSLFRSNTLHI